MKRFREWFDNVGGDRPRKSQAAILLFAGSLLMCPASVAFGQNDNGNEAGQSDAEYATGLIPPTAGELAAVQPTPLTRAFLPEAVDLSSRFPTVGNQGRLGSCVSWAVGYAARSYYSGLGKTSSIGRSDIASPAYLHGIIRRPDPKEGKCGGGASIGDAFDVLRTGAASLNDMPYSDRDCRRPDEALMSRVESAGSFRISREIIIRNMDEDSRQSYLDKIKTELSRGNPVVIGVYTNQALYKMRGKNGKKVWKHTGPKDHKKGHAITLVGYDERGQYFKFINSWGTGWGDKGFGKIAYETVSDLEQQRLAYSMRVAGVEPPQPIPVPDPSPVPAPKPPQVAGIKLPEVSCGLLAQSRMDGRDTIAGFVREQADIDRIKVAIGGRDVMLDVALRPWPQCEALMTLRAPLKDQGKPTVTLPAASYKEGDTFSFKVGMAPFEGYLHVAYVQADGNVVNLVQQGSANLQTLGRGAELTFGDGAEGRDKFIVSEPYGKEMVIAISSASPLFPEPRPTVEVEREFLSALRAAILARPDPSLPERRISAAYALLETKGASK